ncbi:MAG: hypothetical protein ABI858_08510 [Pseudoxanthomonas sp.]
MNASKTFAIALFAALLPLGAQAAEPAASSTRSEIKREMADARTEVRAEMAKARVELDRENLSLDQGLHFGKHGKKQSARQDSLPAAQITPKGDLLINGEAVAINNQQRLQLLDYRGQVLELARIGIDGGEKAAMAALDATDVSLFSLIVGGLSGSLERRVESSVKQHVVPLVRQICRRLPQVLESQQRLSTSLAQFRPYASLESDDIKDCEREVLDEVAAR